MPREKRGTYDHKGYQNEYHKAMKNKLISFNPNKPEDMELWDFMMQHSNVTGYLKSLIRKDKEAKESPGCANAQGGE